MTFLGVNVGNDARDITQFEHWLDRPVDICSVFVDADTWDGMMGSVSFEISAFSQFSKTIVWSIPLIPKMGQLQDAASGSHDDLYRRMAQLIAGVRHGATLYVRTGWEQNGSWMRWAAKGREDLYINSYRRLVKCFQQSSPRFKFIWCPNIGQNNPELSYPGDDVVDIVGLDVYYFPQWDPKTAEQAWFYMVSRPFGLQWHLAFSRRHKKPIAFPEWGVNSNDFGPYIRNMAGWCKAGNALYQAYWNSDADYKGKLSSGQYPRTGEAFRKAFRSP